MTASALTELFRDVAERHQLPMRELVGPGRTKRLAYPRQEAMWLARHLVRPDGSPRFSFPQIGRALGRDHATVIYGVRAHEARKAGCRLVRKRLAPDAATTPAPKPVTEAQRQAVVDSRDTANPTPGQPA